jgi:hypothetical protein
MAYFAFFVFLGFFFERKISARLFNIRGIRTVISSALFLFIVVSSAQLFHQLRILGSVGILQDLNMKSLARVARLYNTSDAEELKFGNAYNVEIRALSTAAAVAKYDQVINSKDIQFGYGQEIYNSFLKATPSGYFVDKASIPLMESLASILTSGAIREDRDMGDSLIVEGMMDFGYFGAILYSVVLISMIGIFYWFLVAVKSSLSVLVFTLTLIFCILTMAEGGIIALVIVLRANMLILLLILLAKVLAYLIKKMPGHPQIQSG